VACEYLFLNLPKEYKSLKKIMQNILPTAGGHFKMTLLKNMPRQIGD
jgi:hypothetical protein